jgi:outer membrane protein assembly factor BamE
MPGLPTVPTLPTAASRRAPTQALTALVALLALGGCSSLPALPSMTSGGDLLGFIKPYRMDIVQGNVVTKEQAALIKPGMTRAQVRDILGSPMLTDVFHADRWDYVFTIVRPGTTPQRRTIVAFFKGDVLDRLEAPDLPTELEFVASISRVRAAGSAPLLELTPEQKKALPVPPKATPEPTPALGALRSYPPLEPS